MPGVVHVMWSTSQSLDSLWALLGVLVVIAFVAGVVFVAWLRD